LPRPLKMDAPCKSVDTFFFKYISEPNETGFEKQASIVKNAIVMRD
jgi:hypothetical protein